MSLVLFLSLIWIQTFSSLQTVEEFSALMKKNYTLVDVRTPEEYINGSLPNALNISVTALNFPLEINRLDKEKPILIFCKSGTRSARAALAMKALGFKQIYELDGGYMAWKAAGLID